MPRDDGFAVADLDTSFFDDPKVRKLWREVHDRSRMAEAVTLYVATVLESWASAERVSAEDAAPIWLDYEPSALASLKAVGLLDAEGKLPRKTWSSWFTPAVDRRAKRRIAGSLGGRGRKPKPDSSTGEAQLEQSSSVAQPDRPSGRSVPSVPTVPTNPTAPQRALSLVQPEDGLPHITPAVQEAAEARVGIGLFSASDRVQTDLDGLVERCGAEEVIAAFPRVGDGKRLSWPQLVYGTRNILEEIPRAPRPKSAQEEYDEAAARLDRKIALKMAEAKA